jgi:hypothetical protein
MRGVKSEALTVVCAAITAGAVAACGASSPVKSASSGSGIQQFTNTVSGTVNCPTGLPVVGIWVNDGLSSGSGWASYSAAGSDGAAFKYTLPSDASLYDLHVGCGGTPQAWAFTYYSPVVSGSKGVVPLSLTPAANQPPGWIDN